MATMFRIDAAFAARPGVLAASGKAKILACGARLRLDLIMNVLDFGRGPGPVTVSAKGLTLQASGPQRYRPWKPPTQATRPQQPTVPGDPSLAGWSAAGGLYQRAGA